jgi:imidazolonepropionase-like amidohydrolase
VGINTPDEGRAAVREHAAAGVDEVKLYANLDRDEFLAIVDEAQKSGLKTVAHLGNSVNIEDAARAGLGSSEHWFGFEIVIARLLGETDKLNNAGMGSNSAYLQRLDEVDPQALQNFYQRLHASGLTVCPTIITFKVGTQTKAYQAGSFPKSEFISQKVLDNWKTYWSQQDNAPDYIWQNWAKMVKQLNKAEVPLMVGTDLILPGIIPGYSVHEEMAIWQAAGIPAADVLRSATLVPAQFMGLGDRFGSIREGKTASMVLLGANPLEDVSNAQQIEGVFLRGQYFSGGDLDRLLVEAKDLAQRSIP